MRCLQSPLSKFFSFKSVGCFDERSLTESLLLIRYLQLPRSDRDTSLAVDLFNLGLVNMRFSGRLVPTRVSVSVSVMARARARMLDQESRTQDGEQREVSRCVESFLFAGASAFNTLIATLDSR